MMIEENGTVVRTDGDAAWVQTARRSSCGACSARKGCGTGALSDFLGARAHEVEVLNPIGAKPGDDVVLGISEALLVRGSMTVYLVPLLALVVGAMLADGMAPQLGLASSELPAIGGGLIGLATGFFWLQRLNRRWRNDPTRRAVILRRAPSAAVVNLLSGNTHAK